MYLCFVIGAVVRFIWIIICVDRRLFTAVKFLSVVISSSATACSVYVLRSLFIL
jgi:hypothetical protein